MRNFNIFLLVLIHGIVSTAIADGETSEPSETGPKTVNILGFVNTTEEEIEKFDIELCEKNGGPNSYQEHIKSREEYERCMSSLRREVVDGLVIPEHVSRGEREIMVYKGHCRRLTGFENCIKDLTISMKTCLDTSKHESADVIYNTASSVMRFLCEDEGKRIEQFMNGHGEECIESKMPHVMECANQTILNYIKSTTSNGASIGGLGKLHLLVPDVNKCTVFEKFRVCALEILRTCAEPTPNIASSVFNLAKKTTTCDRFLKSKASPASVINVILISTVMAISLRFA